MSDCVEVLIKKDRYQAKKIREDTDREARATDVVAVRPFGGADKSLLAGGQKYRLEKPDQISVILKVENSGFGTLKKQRFGSKFVEYPSLNQPLKPEELADMNMEDIMKENLGISVKKVEIMSDRQLGVALDYFVLKEQRQAINENVEETLISHNKKLIKRSRGKDKDEQEGGLTFMINTAAAVQEMCMVEGGRARERTKVEDKGNREKRQAADNKAKKKRYLPPTARHV